jgi:hypothetical protein
MHRSGAAWTSFELSHQADDEDATHRGDRVLDVTLRPDGRAIFWSNHGY